MPESFDPPLGPDVEPDVDPDVDLRDVGQRAEFLGHELDVLLAIAVGGVLGAEARYGLGLLVPHAPGTWPWATLIINVVGSAVLGALMTIIADLDAPPRLLRPFVGVGICGGFTTFSTFTVDTYQLYLAGRVPAALLYAVASVLACVAGVLIAAPPTRTVLRRVTR